ncbi:MAG: LptF/LptG family permease [Bacteroidales bacterium]|nr:LptF/LptG family permease [Bacteroidales bacterium]
MLKKIDWYIIKKFIGTYVFAIALIIAISVVFDINEKIDRFLDPQVPLNAIIFDYYLNFIPYFVNLFSPLFTFIAVIFFTSKMADNSEIIAILSSGMSFRRLMVPYMISALLISASTFYLNGYVIPPANIKRLNFQHTYINNKKVTYASNVQAEVEPGVVVYFDRYDSDMKRGYRFSMEKFEEKHLKSRLTAQRIEYDSAYHWILHNYMIRDFNGMKEEISSGSIKDTTIHIMPSDFLISKSDGERMTNPELRKYIKRQKDRGIGNITIFELEYAKRFSMAMASFILTTIGVSLSSRKVKGGMGFNIGIGLLLSFSYILFMTVSSTFAISGMMSPVMAVWLPNIIYTLIAVYLYNKAPR